MVLDLILTCLIFFGSGLVFGLSLYLLLYLAVAPFRKWLDGKVLFGAVLFSVVPALCLTPFVLNKMWFNNYKQLEAYLQQNPSCDMQLNYIDERGYSLGSWSLERYREYVSNKLKAERRDALDKIGFMMKCSSNPNFI